MVHVWVSLCLPHTICDILYVFCLSIFVTEFGRPNILVTSLSCWFKIRVPLSWSCGEILNQRFRKFAIEFNSECILIGFGYSAQSFQIIIKSKAFWFDKIKLLSGSWYRDEANGLTRTTRSGRSGCLFCHAKTILIGCSRASESKSALKFNITVILMQISRLWS